MFYLDNLSEEGYKLIGRSKIKLSENKSSYYFKHLDLIKKIDFVKKKKFLKIFKDEF